MTLLANVDEAALREAASELVNREAGLLDEARWSEWLSLYVEECVFWIPAWKADGTLVTNPRREVSHVYMEGKGALEDRIVRIQSGQAAASIPMQRTTHLLGRTILRDRPEPGRLTTVTPWTSHVYFPRHRRTEMFFGRYEHSLVEQDDGWKIARKRIIVNNDFIRTIMDFYCV